MQFRPQPLVQGTVFNFLAEIRFPLVQIGIGDKERVSIPQGQDEIAHDLTHQIRGKPSFLSWRCGGIEIPTHGIRPMLIDHLPRVNDIAFGFGHLLTVSIQNQPETDHILKTDLFEKQGANGMQRIEPAARLVHCLADVISRKLLFEHFLILERIMPLRDWHGS